MEDARMTKIKVMAIAPYDGLVEILNRVGSNFSELDIDTLKGDLEEGQKIAMNAEKEGYDLIISRGGTSEMIKKAVSIPVVNIEVSGYDYIRAMKLVQRFSGKSALVGFPFITSGAERMKDLLMTDLDIITIGGEEEVEPLLRRLSREGYSLIVGDAITEKTARRLGINGMLLTSGDESVMNAFEEAIRIYSVVEKYKKASDSYRMIVEGKKNCIIAFDREKRIVFSNFDEKMHTLFLDDFLEHFEDVLANQEASLLLEKDGTIYSVEGKVLEDSQEFLVAFYLQERTLSPAGKLQGIFIRNLDTQNEIIPSLFRNRTNKIAELIDKVRDYSKTRLPILIEGGLGVGKEILAYWIHLNSDNKLKPFITVNCNIVNRESLDYFLENWDGILPMGTGVTLFVKEIEKLDTESQKKLLDLLKRSEFSQSSRIIASTTKNLPQLAEKLEFDAELYYQVSKLNLYVPSLRERIDEIDNLCNLYIIEANSKFGKQIIQIDDDAVGLLKSVNWIYNFEQLRKIVYELVLSAQSAKITKDDVEDRLSTDKMPQAAMPDFIGKFSNLEEMEAHVIRSVLEKENGNQVKAAQRLGISRSTLWRKMKIYHID